MKLTINLPIDCKGVLYEDERWCKIREPNQAFKKANFKGRKERREVGNKKKEINVSNVRLNIRP